MTHILEQLKNFCDCVNWDKYDVSIMERNVEEMINLISNLTCWANSPCETFLNSQRSEMIDVPKFDPCTCDGGILEFEPFYKPFQPDTFKVLLITEIGINEETIPLMEGIDYNFNEYSGKLKINVRPYIKNVSCGCPERSKLLIQYDAGYSELPECLLQLFCDLLHVITAKNDCQCETCTACNVSNTEGIIEYKEGDEISPMLNKWFNNLIESGYELQLGQISLCDCVKQKIWGVVI